MRNTRRMVEASEAPLDRAVAAQLMHLSLQKREGKRVVLPDGREVIEFINCSYLGLDQHPDVIRAGQQVLEEWGVHFCCARSRFSIGPHKQLEEGLSQLFRGHAITFPSVTTTHMSVLPLLASGILLEGSSDAPVHMIFDRFAHASMQYLKPILATEAELSTLPHNDLEALRERVKQAQGRGYRVVYLADGVYSMGGFCPIGELLPMAQELGFSLYIDDAHGTSIFGAKGEGYIMSQIEGPLPPGVFVNFSLAKGFGCNGGGVVVPDARSEERIRRFGQTYMFSAPLDFSMIGAALASLQLHLDGSLGALQQKLAENIEAFAAPEGPGPQGPIQMILAGQTERALAWGEALIDQGFFVTTAFFPVVPRDRAQLRVAITAAHSLPQIHALRQAIDELRQRP